MSIKFRTPGRSAVPAVCAAAIAALSCFAAALAVAAPQGKQKTGEKAEAKSAIPSGPLKWELKHTENFNGVKLNTKLWKRIEQGQSDWNRYMSLRDDLVEVKGGVAKLYGVKNNDKSADPRDFLTGGISTSGLFNMKYGKVEVRAKLEAATGAWPAIWLMPENSKYPWPKCGEIDIIERVNHDPFVYNTAHSEWSRANRQNPPMTTCAKIKPDAWNVFAFEWTPDKLVWRVNGSVTLTYPKLSDDVSKWPWTQPSFLLIDMQLGGNWVGAVDEKTLPVAMHIDWVRFYQLKQGNKVISEFTKP